MKNSRLRESIIQRAPLTLKIILMPDEGTVSNYTGMSTLPKF